MTDPHWITSGRTSAPPKPTLEHYVGAAAVSVSLFAMALLFAAGFASGDSAGRMIGVMVVASLLLLSVVAVAFRLMVWAFARASTQTRSTWKRR